MSMWLPQPRALLSPSLSAGGPQVLAKQSEPLCWGCFDEDLRRLVRKAVRLKGLIRPGDRILAAVSGGDAPHVPSHASMLRAAQRKMGYSLHATQVQHRWRCCAC